MLGIAVSGTVRLSPLWAQAERGASPGGQLRSTIVCVPRQEAGSVLAPGAF